MNRPITYVKNHLFPCLTLAGSLLFYLFFAFYDGAVICVDSPTYLEMSFAREPFYPLFLAFFRSLGTNNYLLYAVIVQSLLMAICSWLLADYLRKKLNIPNLYSLILYLIPIGTSFLCRFVAQRSAMYTNSILTEGICTSLYLLFIYFILRYLWEASRVSLMASLAVAFLMISSRKQMLMVLPLFTLAVLYSSYKNKNLRKGILTAAAGCILVLLSFLLFDCTYNYFLRGSFMRHSSSNRFVTTMVFYNAEAADADYIEDEDTRDLFLKIYKVCDEAGYLGNHAGEGWYNEVTHFGDHYDHIQIDTMWPMILERARETVDSRETSVVTDNIDIQYLYDLQTDTYNSRIISSILPHQIPKLIKSLWNNFLSGLVTTVAQRRPILVIYTLLIYPVYLLLTAGIFLLARRRSTDSKTAEKYITLSLLTLAGIICNVGLVSAVIFCQTRYTIYNMPLFYMAGAVLLYENIRLCSASVGK